MQSNSAERLAILALLGGAAGIGFAPIFVRLSEVGPSATAFYRILFALPFLWLASSLEANSGRARAERPAVPPQAAEATDLRPLSSTVWLFVLPGIFFAGDLAFWHWSIKLTTVANSTLLTNCAPFFVILGARLLFGERLTPVLIVGMLVASTGAAMLVGTSLTLTAQHLLGDFLALVTAGFYGGYLLSIKYLRMSFSTARILAWSGSVSCALLLLISLLSRESIRITSTRGWLVLFGLALISHIGGQGLIAYALAHLPAGFSSVGLLLQPLVAAILAWFLLGEALTPLQALGGVVVLLGITLASWGRKSRAS